MRLNKFTITFFLLLALLATVTLAQQNSKQSSGTTSRVPETPTSTEAQAEATSTSDPPPEQTSTSQAPQKTSTSSQPTQPTQPTQQVTTPTEKPPSLTTSTSDAPLPGLTDSSGATLPPKPKLSTSIEYPKPTVPPTANAPFMQKSKLPEGTFFIAVGAALGFLLFSVFAWRMIVAWSLHRSVKRAAEQANAVDSKAMLRAPAGGNSGGFYAAGVGSSVSLGDLSRGAAGAKQTPNSSLFFSPTAGVTTAGDRRSAYLPAGYYPSGNGSGSLGPNASQTHFHTQSMSSRYGYDRRGMGPSPPGSPLIAPSVPPSRGGNGSPALRPSESRTSLSVSPVQGQRAPSAYLEDLFENHQQQPGGRY